MKKSSSSELKKKRNGWKSNFSTHLNNKNPIPVTAALRTSSFTSETFFYCVGRRRKMERKVKCEYKTYKIARANFIGDEKDRIGVKSLSLFLLNLMRYSQRHEEVFWWLDYCRCRSKPWRWCTYRCDAKLDPCQSTDSSRAHRSPPNDWTSSEQCQQPNLAGFSRAGSLEHTEKKMYGERKYRELWNSQLFCSNLRWKRNSEIQTEQNCGSWFGLNSLTLKLMVIVRIF